MNPPLSKRCRVTAICFLVLWGGLLIGPLNGPAQSGEERRSQEQTLPRSLPDDCSPKCYQEADRMAQRCHKEMITCQRQSPENQEACRRDYDLCSQKVTEWAQSCLHLCGKNPIRPH